MAQAGLSTTLSRKPSASSPMSPIPKMIAQRRCTVARALLVSLPISAELVRFQRTNRQSDFPFGRRELDDLHRVRLPDLQIDLLLFAGAVRVVELGNVNQSLDPLVELDEGAEVRHAHD